MNTKTTENWKEIVYNEEKTGYFISNFGNVYSSKSEVILKHDVSKYGYHRVTIYVNATPIRKLVHRLVATYFIANPENKPHVNHIDGDKSNNSSENLEWATVSENNQHAFDTGLKHAKHGNESHFAKYKVDDVILACKLMESGIFTLRKISDRTGISYDMILNIYHRKSWTNISNQYDVENCLTSHANYLLEDIEKVFQLLEADELSIYDISDATNVSASTITSILLHRNNKFPELYEMYDIQKYHKNKIIKPFSKESQDMIIKLINEQVPVKDIIIIINEKFNYNTDRIRHYYHRLYKKHICSTTIENTKK